MALEYRNMKSVATRSNTKKVPRRPWDVYFRDSEIEEDDVAFIVATNMLKFYSTYPLSSPKSKHSLTLPSGWGVRAFKQAARDCS